MKCAVQLPKQLFFFDMLCQKRRLTGCVKEKKKTKARRSSTGYRGDRWRPSLQTLIIECYPAALKYAQTIIIPPSVFNYGRGKGEGPVGGEML